MPDEKEPGGGHFFSSAPDRKLDIVSSGPDADAIRAKIETLETRIRSLSLSRPSTPAAKLCRSPPPVPARVGSPGAADLLGEYLRGVPGISSVCAEAPTPRPVRPVAQAARAAAAPRVLKPRIPTVNPEPFQGGDGLSKDPLDWLEQFERVAGANQWDAELAVQQFSLMMRGEARVWFDNLVSELEARGENTVSYPRLRVLFQQRFVPPNLASQLWRQFHSRVQGPGESVSAFADDVLRLGRRLHVSAEERMRVFVEGLHQHLRSVVIPQEPRDMTSALRLAMLAEGAFLPRVGGGGGVVAPVTAVQPMGSGAGGGVGGSLDMLADVLGVSSSSVLEAVVAYVGDGARRDGRTADARPQCSNCGRAGHHTAACRQRGRVGGGSGAGGGAGGGGAAAAVSSSDAGLRCYNCGVVGHRAAACPQPARPRSRSGAGGGGGGCFACGSSEHRLQGCPLWAEFQRRGGASRPVHAVEALGGGAGGAPAYHPNA